MNAPSRLLFAAAAVALSVASCGQKGPLVLPEDDARAPSVLERPTAVRRAAGRSACATCPRA